MEQTEIVEQKQDLSVEVNKIVAHVDEMTIANADDMEKAADVLKYIKMKLKKIDEERTELVKPLNDHVKMINERFKAYSVPLSNAEVALKTKVSAYVSEEKRKQAELAAKAEEERKAAMAKAELDGNKEWELPPPPPVAAPVTKARGGFGAIHTREVWTYEVEDISKVPLAFITVDDARVKEAIAEGRRDIPGLKVFAKETVVSR